MKILLALLHRYWLHMAVAALLIAAQGYALRWAWVHGGDAARLECERSARELIEAQADELAIMIKRKDAAQRKADELEKLPPKVVTVVRNNPSSCVLPRPVTDSMRDQVRETNSAIRSMR